MCRLTLYYYESENIFVDEEGEIVYDLFRIITPSDLYLFHEIPDDYEFFPMVDHPDVDVYILTIPKEPICGQLYNPQLDLRNCYELYEEHERFGTIFNNGN